MNGPRLVRRAIRDTAALGARQMSAASIAPGGAATTTTASLGSAATSVTGDFSFSAPPNQQIWPLPGKSSPLTVRCTNRTVAGDITLSSKLFPSNSLADKIENGEFQLSTSNLHTNLSFSLNTTAANPLLDSYTFGLSNTNTSYHIPEVGSISLAHGIGVNLGVDLAANSDFLFGAALSVPDNSTLSFDLSDLSSANINASGFSQSTFTPSPFTSSISNISLTLSMAGFASFSIAGTLLDQHLDASASIQLPNLGLTVTPMPNGDVNCAPATSGSQSVQQLLGNNGFGAISFVPTANVSADVDDDIGSSARDQLVALNHSFTLPTACYAFDKTKGSVVPAAQAVAAASSASKGAAARLGSPVADGSVWGFGAGVQMVVVALGVGAGVAFVF